MYLCNQQSLAWDEAGETLACTRALVLSLARGEESEAGAALQGCLHRLVVSTARAARCVVSRRDQSALLVGCGSTLVGFARALRQARNVTLSGESMEDPVGADLLVSCRIAATGLAQLMTRLREMRARD